MGNIVWSMVGTAFCEDTLNVDFAFLIGDENIRTSRICYVDENKLILNSNLISSNIKEDFLDCTKISIRVHQKTCGTKIYNFNTKNSGRALKFIYRN